MADVKILTEKGIIVCKVHKNPSEQFVADGRVIPAQPDRYLVGAVVGHERPETGLENPTLVPNIKVDKMTYDKCKYLDACEVTYEHGGKYPKPKEFEHIGPLPRVGQVEMNKAK